MKLEGKLELTWVGKNEEIKLEPRILVEDKSKSYGDPNSQNMLIHGDNLLALKALEKDFAGKIKCIYIDPPFNTGSRINADGDSVGYEDGVEHSIWLNMMYTRLKILYNLLSEDGAIFIHLDDNESDYCKLLMDEIFGRQNFMNRITVDARSPSAFSTVNPGMFVASEHILYYAKKRNKLIEKRIKTARNPDSAYDKFILNFEEGYENWQFKNVYDVYIDNCSPSSHQRPDKLLNKYYDFILKNADRIIRLTAISDSGAGRKVVDLKYESLKNPQKIYKLERANYDDIYIINGQQIAFYSKNVSLIDGKLVATKMLTDIWHDIAWEGIAGEGSVTFKKGKKPERLIKRCIDLVTNEGDFVLDSFAGSGTTAAVAHKMHRKWIAIELGNHAYTHCKVRMDKVVDGEQSGISKITNWTGGGGYKFYELAESLLVKNDKLPIYQINPNYTFEMMCEAICKIEGFDYKVEGSFHGKSSENRFIHITTEFVNAEYIKNLSKELSEKQSLLIYSTKFATDLRLPDNIVVKKIPKDLLKKCKFESEVR